MRPNGLYEKAVCVHDCSSVGTQGGVPSGDLHLARILLLSSLISIGNGEGAALEIKDRGAGVGACRFAAERDGANRRRTALVYAEIRLPK